jgi:hypothetical protein
LVAIFEGRTHEIGSLTHMGPGFFPILLGSAMMFVGLLIVGSAAWSPSVDHVPFLPAGPQWRGWACIIAGPILFIALAEHAGLAPAALACVFVSAFGDRTATLKTTFFLAIGVTAFGVILFHYLLSVPLPVLRGVLQ